MTLRQTVNPNYGIGVAHDEQLKTLFKEKRQKMKFPKLTNGQYDRIKQFLLMVVPAATAVITGIGVMNGFSTEKVTGTIALLATFAGILLNWIAGKYDKEE